MAAYIDGAFYMTYTGEAVLPDDFPVLSARASEVIDIITFHRISQAGGITAYPAWIQEAIRKATAAQAQQMDADGGAEAITGADYQSVAVGKFSYSAGQRGGGARVGNISIASLVAGYLEPTGLLYRGLDYGC